MTDVAKDNRVVDVAVIEHEAWVYRTHRNDPHAATVLGVLCDKARDECPVVDDAMVKVLGIALEHVQELREAWERGAISEHDGLGGTRSNRNVTVETILRAVLAVPEPPCKTCEGTHLPGWIEKTDYPCEGAMNVTLTPCPDCGSEQPAVDDEMVKRFYNLVYQVVACADGLSDRQAQMEWAMAVLRTLAEQPQEEA